MEPIHTADCYTEVVKVEGKAYHTLAWNCTDECPLNDEVTDAEV